MMTLAAEYRDRDRQGTLAEAFAAASTPLAAEEGWILGVEHDSPSGQPVSTPRHPLSTAAPAVRASTAIADTRPPTAELEKVQVAHRQARSIGARQANVRAGMALDFEKARRFIQAVPNGRWTAYKDVAIAAGDHSPTGPWRIGQRLRQSGGSIPNYWRVLTVDGLVPDEFVGGGSGPHDARAAREALRKEGVMGADGEALKQRRFFAENWSEAIQDQKRPRPQRSNSDLRNCPTTLRRYKRSHPEPRTLNTRSQSTRQSSAKRHSTSRR